MRLEHKIAQNPDYKIMIMSFRISLTKQYLNDKFSGIPDLKSYQDITGSIYDKTSRLIIQPESLHRVWWSECDEIVIDEITQVIKQLTSPTFIKQPSAKRSFEVFKQLIRTAKTIHIMDANLTQDDIDFIESIRTTKDTTEIYYNEHVQVGKKIQITKNKTDIVRLAQTDIKEGKKFYIAHNGAVDKIKVLEAMLKATKPEAKILTIHSKTLSKDHVIKALANPNEEWVQYDGVICSPSIQSGISFDPSDVFTNIYGIFGNYTNSTNDCNQMLHRIREPINKLVRVSINTGNQTIGPTTKKQIEDSFKAKNRHTMGKDMIKDLGHIMNYELDSNGYEIFDNCYFYKLYL
jgi:hypothetical protein